MDGAIENFGHWLGTLGYVEYANQNGEVFAKLPLQYIENHDYSRFICEFGLSQRDWNRYLEKETVRIGTGSSRI